MVTFFHVLLRVFVSFTANENILQPLRISNVINNQNQRTLFNVSFRNKHVNTNTLRKNRILWKENCQYKNIFR